MTAGVYALVLRLKCYGGIVVGGLGQINFKKGFYVYVGSALGPGGLEARLCRHFIREKKRHWHIDYLLEKAEVVGVKVIESRRRVECKLASGVSFLSDEFVPNFGSSDCRCQSHLFHFKTNPLKNRGFNRLFPK